MKTAIGLFEQRSQAEAVAEFARRGGVPENNVKVIDRSAPPEQWIEPGPRPITMKAVRSFAVLGMAVFGIFGLFTAVASVYVTAAPIAVAVQFLVIFVLIGLFSGLFMGWIKGRSDADGAIQHFRELFQQGGVIASVESDKYAKTVRSRMRQEKALLVFVEKSPRPMSALPEVGELAPAPSH
jgi:hypothetical protein